MNEDEGKLFTTKLKNTHTELMKLIEDIGNR